MILYVPGGPEINDDITALVDKWLNNNKSLLAGKPGSGTSKWHMVLCWLSP
jgi:hypothetical protein